MAMPPGLAVAHLHGLKAALGLIFPSLQPPGENSSWSLVSLYDICSQLKAVADMATNGCCTEIDPDWPTVLVTAAEHLFAEDLRSDHSTRTVERSGLLDLVFHYDLTARTTKRRDGSYAFPVLSQSLYNTAAEAVLRSAIQKHPHSVGSWLHDVRRDVSW